MVKSIKKGGCLLGMFIGMCMHACQDFAEKKREEHKSYVLGDKKETNQIVLDESIKNDFIEALAAVDSDDEGDVFNENKVLHDLHNQYLKKIQEFRRRGRLSFDDGNPY